MRTPLSRASMVLLAAFLCLLSCQQAQATYVSLSSSISYNPNTNQVTGVSQTAMEYYTQLYYQAEVEGNLYQQGNSNPISSGTNSSGTTAVVTTHAFAASNANYSLVGKHFLISLVYGAGICTDYTHPYEDYLGYFGECGTFPDPNYPGYYGEYQCTFSASATIYPTGIVWCSVPNFRIYPGNTNTSLRAPTFHVSISDSSGRVAGDIGGTTQNALVGGIISLQSSINPSGAGSSYQYDFSSPAAITGGATNSPSVAFRPLGPPGVLTVGCTVGGVRSTFQIIQVVPTISSFTANAVGNVLDRGSACSNIQYGGATYTMGCYTGVETGIVWSATVHIPNVTYLIDRSQSGIKFKQAVSVFDKRMNNGRVELRTARSPITDVNSGYQLDTSDPYNHPEHPAQYFGQATSLQMGDFDAPGTSLDGTFNGTPFSYDAKIADSHYQIYVFYFVGSTPGTPDFEYSQPLTLDNSGGVAGLTWAWGGQVSFNAVQPILYGEQQGSSTTSTGPLSATVSGAAVSMQGVTNGGSPRFQLFPGAVDTHNPIDGSNFFLQQLYLGFYRRNADTDGLNYWRSQIASCGFDTVCIYGNDQSGQGKRFAVSKAFFYAPEATNHYPGLANPPGSTGFDPSVYNPAFVTACYNGFYARDPDSGGLSFWVNNLNQNGNYDGVLNAFLISDEFRLRFGAVNPHY